MKVCHASAVFAVVLCCIFDVFLTSSPIRRLRTDLPEYMHFIGVLSLELGILHSTTEWFLTQDVPNDSWVSASLDLAMGPGSEPCRRQREPVQEVCLGHDNLGRPFQGQNCDYGQEVPVSLNNFLTSFYFLYKCCLNEQSRLYFL